MGVHEHACMCLGHMHEQQMIQYVPVFMFENRCMCMFVCVHMNQMCVIMRECQ